MLKTRIKICGLTTPEQAIACTEAGADAIGLVFFPPSPRHVSLDQAAVISKALPPFATKVGLFLNPSKETVLDTLSQVPLDLLQFHGDESADFCRQFDRPYIKAVPMGNEALDPLSYEAQFMDALGFLYDSNKLGAAGGSGHTFDWARWPKAIRGRFRIVAGGLDEFNVSTAVRELLPYAVDVSSGVEQSPGNKNIQRVKEFVDQVRLADEQP